MAVEHLIAGHHRRIATVTGPLDMGAGIDRLQGYRDAIRNAGLQSDGSFEQAGDFGQASGAAAMQALLDRHPDLDAVFCASDVMAAGALEVLRRQRPRVAQNIYDIRFYESTIAKTTGSDLFRGRTPIHGE